MVGHPRPVECPDSPTGTHEISTARWDDTICIWCFEDPKGPPMPGTPRPLNQSAWMYQHLRAPNDSSGNPRRLYLVLRIDKGDPYIHVHDVVDEGYLGRGALDAAGYPQREMLALPTIDIGAAEYRIWLKRGQEDPK